MARESELRMALKVVEAYEEELRTQGDEQGANEWRHTAYRLRDRLEELLADDGVPEMDLPGAWSKSDYIGGLEEVRGPDWKPTDRK